MIVTDDDLIAKKCRILRNQGRDTELDWFDHVSLGYNYRLSDINCALGIGQLRRIGKILDERAAAAAKYHERLKRNPHLITPDIEFSKGLISWFVYVIRLREYFTKEQRDFVVNEMQKSEIGCGRYFAPIHLQPLYVEKFGYKTGDFPLAECAAERVLALPFFNKISDAQIEEVCETLEKNLNRLR